MSFCTPQSSSRLGGTWNAIFGETELRFGEFNVPHPLIGRDRWDRQAYNHHSLLVGSRSLICFQGASLSLIHSYILCSGFFTCAVASYETCTSGQCGN